MSGNDRVSDPTGSNFRLHVQVPVPDPSSSCVPSGLGVHLIRSLVFGSVGSYPRYSLPGCVSVRVLMLKDWSAHC